MYLSHLDLENFRLFVRFARDLPRGPLLIVGGNAQGKTTLLEAVAYLSTFSSFLAHTDRELVHFLARREPLAVSRVRGICRRRDGAVRLEARIIHTLKANNGKHTRKEILVNGVKRKRVDALGHCATVLFLPHMLHLVDGAPELRRRFWNQTLAQAWPQYAHHVVQYHKVLSQRNALLKQIQEGRARVDSLDVWDARLAELAGHIMYARGQTLLAWNRLLTRHHWDLLRQTEPLRFVYRPALDVPEVMAQGSLFGGHEAPEVPELVRAGPEVLAEHLRQRLAQQRAYDIRRGNTGLGPHRDDFRFYAGGLDLAVYGSRGQVRTALLLLKLAEAAWFRERFGEPPILLLDDLLAELDPQRREQVLRHFLEAGEQILLTATEASMYPESLREVTEIWHLEAGRVVSVTPPARPASATLPDDEPPPQPHPSV
ncbi:MAG: DNA replication/repair protein RecF [Chloroflexi bacterium]|nr:DNA replication/repair protein RecF [Chloroflexota bacterium]